MASPDPPRRIAAENKGSGTQPLHQGNGDQGVLKGDNGVQNLIRSQKVFHFHGPSMSQMAELIHQGEDAFDQPSRVSIIEWLKLESQLDFRAHHQTLLDQMVTGTGTWALEGKGFQAWINASNPSQFFWIYGILGSGKTMLSSLIVDSLEKVTEDVENTACIYLYFQDGQDQPSESRQEQRPTFANILINLLIQLLQCQSSDDVVEELQAKYADWRSRMMFPTSDDYINLFNAEVATFEKVYLVVDALENCQNSVNENTHDKMQALLRSMPENVKVLVTSRGGLLDSWGLREDQKFELQPKREDVEMYVKSRIRENRVIQRDPDPNFQAKVVHKVVKATRGIFLLTKLHMDSLDEQGTLGGIKSALEMLPETVHSAFETSIRKIKMNGESETKRFDLGLAKHVLSWVVVAAEPLNATQICHSFAICHSTKTLNSDFLPEEAELTSVCAGLVTMDPKTKVLSLVHESVLDYLWSHDIVPKSSDMDVAKMCLRYLLFKEPEQDTERPLLNYAARYWLKHFCLGEQHVDDEAENLAMKFLSDNEKVQIAFQVMAGKNSLALWDMTGLHAAIHFNRRNWAERLIAQDAKVDATCSDGRTALHWAAKDGRSDMVELLTQKSADTNIQDRNGDTPLHLAIMWSTKDCTDVVHKLVKAGARVDIRGGRGYTPLTWAMRYGPSSIAKLLAENQADVNAEDQGWTSLREAMDQGQPDIIEILLNKGADLNRPSSVDGWTPLRKVVQDGDVKMVHRLLKMGAKVDLRDEQNGYSPLRWAVLYKHESIVQQLLNQGAKVDETANDGSTALMGAVATKETIAWMLLENGANPDVRDNEGRTALHYAVRKKLNSVIWLLIMKKATVAIRNTQGLSCLDLAVQNNDLSVIWLLCENGAKADDANDVGMTALHLASFLGHLEIVRFFLDRKTNTTLKDQMGDTALHRAVKTKHKDIAGLLTSRGGVADIEDGMGLTALSIATQSKDLAMMRALLDNGASCDTQYKNGMTALHQAVAQKFTEGVRLLLTKSSNPDVKDNLGFTALHQAVVQGFNEGIRILLRNSANPDMKDNQGFAATHRAVWLGNKDIVVILVKGGANVNIQDEDNRTPLIHAVQIGKEQLVTALLDEGADVNVRAKNGWTAAEFAGNHGLIRGLLQRAGASR